MKIRILTLISLITCLASPLRAQNPTLESEYLVDGYHLPHAGRLVVDDAGCTYVIGHAYADGQHLDALLVKLGPAGEQMWDLFLDGYGHDLATGLALDSAGDVWLTGWTDSADFPVVEPMDGTLTGFRDAFLMKVDADNGAILYSTYLGGDYAEKSNDIVIDADDRIYLTGSTGSTDFPVTEDAYRPVPGFPEYFYEDGFITVLNPEGNQILYSTYFGGTHDDEGQRIALDGAGNIIVVGNTNADDIPLVGAFDTTPNDLFIFKLSTDGSTVLYGSYLGGNDIDRLTGMVADPAGNVYLTGPTRSPDFPTTAGSFQEDFAGQINGCEVPFGADYNCEDFFVCKISTTGQGMLWGTYLGGDTVDEPKDIAIDPQGNAYVAGYTYSADFPQGEIDFGAEIVVCKIDQEGQNLAFTFALDSGSANRGNGIAVDADGVVVFSGTLGVPASILVGRLDQGAILSSAGDIPVGFRLEGNYPNPFNPSTRIAFTVPGSGDRQVKLAVFDTRGQLVRELLNDRLSAGSHSVTWNGTDRAGRSAAAGVYYYRLDWGSQSLTRPMTLLK